MDYEYLLEMNLVEFNETVKELSWDALHDACVEIKNLDYIKYAKRIDYIEAVIENRKRKWHY